MICDDHEKAKDELIKREPVLYQKAMFRAFLRNEKEEITKFEYLSEEKKIKNISELNEYLNEKSNNGYEFVKKHDTIKTLIYPYFGTYTFKKETKESDTMTIGEYMDNLILLKEVLRIIHAPYQKSDNE